MILRAMIVLLIIMMILTIMKAIEFHYMIDNIVPIMTGHKDVYEK